MLKRRQAFPIPESAKRACPNMPTASSAAGLTVMIDNYDSFTYNVFQYLCELGCNVEVFRNDKVTVDEIKLMNPERIVISPGPGRPAEAGISMDIIREFAGRIPIFGICLGMQSIYEVFGGKVVCCDEIKHGKTSLMVHEGLDVFRGLPPKFRATRYHSLIGSRETLPECLEITAETENGIIMGVRHREMTVSGVQFHPESFITEHGHALMRNFLQVTGGTWKN
eukprot:211103_1